MATSDINARMVSVDEAKAAIEAGRVLWIGGDEKLLKQLPKGRWIGGSIPYFMGDKGGVTTKQQLYVSELDPAIAKRIQVKFYNTQTISNPDRPSVIGERRSTMHSAKWVIIAASGSFKPMLGMTRSPARTRVLKSAKSRIGDRKCVSTRLSNT